MNPPWRGIKLITSLNAARQLRSDFRFGYGSIHHGISLQKLLKANHRARPNLPYRPMCPNVLRITQVELQKDPFDGVAGIFKKDFCNKTDKFQAMFCLLRDSLFFK